MPDVVSSLKLGAATTNQVARAADSSGTLGFASMSTSRGATVLNPTSGLTIMVWRAPTACTVGSVRGHFKGGTSVVYNARRNQSSNLLASDRTMSTPDVWDDVGSVQNTAFAAGDDLEIMIVTVNGSVTEASVQVDFTRP